MKVHLDIDLCQGHGACKEECPEVFDVVERGGEYPQVVLLMEHPPESLREKVKAAVKYCPNKVIYIE